MTHANVVSVFAPIQDSFEDDFKGTQAVFLIGAAFAALGGIVAWTLIPDRERTLETEDKLFREYLDANGWIWDSGIPLEAELKSTTFQL